MNGKTKTMMAAGWVLLLAVGFGCRIPDLDRFDPVAETVSGTGVSAKVTVVRDAHGIVHIEAETDEDLFFGVGYAMAQDRFTQMDYFRRAGAGRLSELFGSPLKISGIGLPNIDIGIRALQFELRAGDDGPFFKFTSIHDLGVNADPTLRGPVFRHRKHFTQKVIFTASDNDIMIPPK